MRNLGYAVFGLTATDLLAHGETMNVNAAPGAPGFLFALRYVLVVGPAVFALGLALRWLYHEAIFVEQLLRLSGSL